MLLVIVVNRLKKTVKTMLLVQWGWARCNKAPRERVADMASVKAWLSGIGARAPMAGA